MELLFLAGKLWGSADELKRTVKFIGDIGLLLSNIKKKN
jgi:hypothetical protein